ncbi:MAG: alpha/beta fold hydrolase [Rhodoblastus sp.]
MRPNVLARLARGAALAAMLIGGPASAVDYPNQKEGDWIAKDVKFRSGETLPEVRLHYTTLGAPTGEPVLVLHGTTGSGTSMLSPAFGGELFGPGQPLDASKYYVILPDAIGHGKSSKPSNGLRAKFPAYNYDDMVALQYRLVTEGLGVKRLRLVIGNSMGGMNAWSWATTYPDMMDAVVPMAAQPTAMSSRNWMMRRLIVDSIRNDPDWKGGDYTAQPRSAAFASVFYGFATAGGTLAWQKAAPTRAEADKIVDARLKAPFPGDANDTLYQWDSSRDYDPSPNLEKITAAVLAINSADDERNPPETGLMDNALKRIKNARLLLIPASAETRGHLTTGMAKFWKDGLKEFLDATPRRATQ